MSRAFTIYQRGAVGVALALLFMIPSFSFADDTVNVDSTNTSAVVTVDSSSGNSSGVYTFRYTVTAADSDVYIPRTIASSGSVDALFSVTKQGALFDGSVISVLDSTANLSGTDAYIVHSGQTQSFTATVTVTPHTTGFYSVSLTGISYSLDPALSSLITAPLTDSSFSSDPQMLTTASSTGSSGADTTPPVVTIDAHGYINQANESHVVFTGVCESGMPVSFSVAGTRAPDADCTSGTWTASVDLSFASDGTLNATATQADVSSNIGSDSQLVKKDTVLPQIIVTGPNPFTMEVGASFVEQGVRANEAIQGSVVTDTSLLDTATPGAYVVKYSATDLAGNTSIDDPSYHRTVIVTGGAQTIIFPAIGTKTYSDTDFSASASASSGLPLTYSANGACSVIDSTVHITGAGSCTITASQAGDSSHAAAPNIDQTFSIAQYAATVTLTGTAVTTIPTGLATTVTYDGSTVVPTAPGTYTILATVTDPNYSGSATGSFVITDTISPVVTFVGPASIDIAQGSSYIEQGASEADNVDSSVPIVTTGSVDTTTAGTYTITYSATDAGGNTGTATRTVNVIEQPRVLPITPSGATITNAGSAAFLVTFSKGVDNVTADKFTASMTGTVAGPPGSPILLVNRLTSDFATYSVTINTASGDGTVTLVLNQNLSQITDHAHVSIPLLQGGMSVQPYTIDHTAPSITIFGDATTTVSQSNDYADAGATATDNVDGTDMVTTTNEVNVSVPGTYHVVYSATDTAGNTTSAIRVVVVEPHIAITAGGGGGGGSGRSSGVQDSTVITGTTPGNDTGTVLGASTFNFATDLTMGSKSQDVTVLQQALISAGFMDGVPTGFFGSVTHAAVMKYQAAHGIRTTGYVGQKTRAQLNLGSVPTLTDEQRSLIMQEILELLAQIKTLQAQP